MAYALNWQSFDGILQDNDLINVTIEHNVAAATTVEFVLEAGPYVTWWKALTLPTGAEIWTQDATTRGVASIIASQLGSGSSLQFKKAKALGVHTGMYTLGSLDQLQSGDRVTFRWIRDGYWRNNAYLQFGAFTGAPLVQGVGRWVRPGAQFQCDVRAANNGDLSWIPGERYKLGSSNPPDNLTWGLAAVDVSTVVPIAGPGYVTVLNLSCTAPSVEGVYQFAWRMGQNGVGWFGNEISETIVVSQNQPQPVPPPTSGGSGPPPPPNNNNPPPPPTSGDYAITMSQQPQVFYIYSGSANDPSQTFAGKGNAVIDQVKNTSGYSFSLAHIDSDGNQTVFVDMGPNDAVGYPFSGLKVEGDWTAEFIGDMVDAPLSLGIMVKWHK